jgi:pimeloyl-ACP methyl ester carboxylesterase
VSTTPDREVSERRVEVEAGVSLAVRVFNPDGPQTPVLCVHGLASNARLWDGMAAVLVDLGHPVAAVDQRGHGQSSKPGTGFDWETLACDLVRVCEDLGWQPGSDRRPIVAGQSWGGNVVLEMAIRQPAALRGLVLVDGGTIELSQRFADWPTCEQALMPPMLAGQRGEDLERLIRLRRTDWPESGIVGTLANLEFLPDGTIRPWLSRDDHRLILRLLWEHRPSERYQLVGVPVLLIPADSGPEGDTKWMAMRREEIERAAAALPDATVRWVVGDHDLHAQHPETLAGLVDEWGQRL